MFTLFSNSGIFPCQSWDCRACTALSVRPLIRRPSRAENLSIKRSANAKISSFISFNRGIDTEKTFKR